MEQKTLKAIHAMMVAAARANGMDPDKVVITICRPPKHRKWGRGEWRKGDVETRRRGERGYGKA